MSIKEGDYPGLYNAANDAAISAQQRYYFFLGFYLWSLVASAAISPFVGCSHWYAIAAAVIFFSGLFLSIYFAVRKLDKAWYSARAVAESVKTRTWRYMMRSEPYGSNQDDSLVDSQFLEDLNTILNQNREITSELSGLSSLQSPISSQMRSIRAMDVNQRSKFYLENRIQDQNMWYANKAEFNRAKKNKYFGIIVFMHAAAIACILLRIAHPDWSFLPTEIFIVLAGSALTWVQSKKYSELFTSYNFTAHEIAILSAKALQFSDEKGLSSYVNDSENAFSREHTQWIARKDTA